MDSMDASFLKADIAITLMVMMAYFLLGLVVAQSMLTAPPAPAPVAVVRPVEASAPPSSVDCPPPAQAQLPSSE